MNQAGIMKVLTSMIVLLLHFKQVRLSSPSTATIAFISESKESECLEAVKSAIKAVNSDSAILPSTTLKLSNSTYSRNKALEYAENLTSDKTLGLFINGFPTPIQNVVGGLLQVPLATTQPKHSDISIQNYISLGPSKGDVNQAISDVIKHHQWTTALIIFDVRWSDQAANFLEILSSNVVREPLGIILDQQGKLFDATKEKLRKINNKLVEAIVLFCDAEFVTIVMEQVHSTRSRTAERAHHWILADMMPSLSMITEPSQIVLAFTPKIEKNVHSQRLMTDLSLNLTEIKNHSYYLYDSVLTFAHALDNVIKNGEYLPETKVINVEATKNGRNILKNMIKVNILGSTGTIMFNGTGDRKALHLELMNLRQHTFVKIGEWTNTGLQITRKAEQNRESTETVPLEKLNRKLKILVIRDAPFLIVTKDPKTGLEKKEGYSVDLVELLAKTLHFKYQLVEPPDGQYGTLKNGTYNGAVGEIINNRADFAAAPLTITSERLNYIKFSKPYMQFSMDIMALKPKSGDIDVLAFMMPYSIPVWVMTLACLAFMTILVSIINHFSPFSHKHGDNDGTGDEFSLFNSFWFSLASMLCQGADNTPKSLSGRIVVGCFWFCILIWVSTYTANLAAFFSFRDTTLGVNSLEDIIKRDYKLFVFAGTPLEETLRTSNFSTYKNLYQKIVSDNSFVKSFDEGIRAVRANSKHLMLEEHPYAESFIHTKPCDLMTVKGFMGVKGYGFAMNKEFPYASNITVAAMKLRETGAIEDLKRKWWNYRSQCHESHEKKPTERLGLEHMVGLYMLVAAGCLLGIISMLFEVLWSAKGEAIKAALPCCFRKEEKEKDEVE